MNFFLYIFLYYIKTRNKYESTWTFEPWTLELRKLDITYLLFEIPKNLSRYTYKTLDRAWRDLNQWRRFFGASNKKCVMYNYVTICFGNISHNVWKYALTYFMRYIPKTKCCKKDDILHWARKLKILFELNVYTFLCKMIRYPNVFTSASWLCASYPSHIWRL